MQPTMRLGLVLLAALAVAGCHQSAPTGVADDPGTASPMNEKERMEAESWAKATEGLDFEAAGGRVEVEVIEPRDEAEAARHLAEAKALFARNRVTEAMEQYGLAARRNPDLADAYVGLGAILRRKGKLDDAAAALRTAIDRDDRHFEARYLLALVLWTPTQHDAAITEMNGLLAIDPDYGRAHERLAVWNFYVADYDAAAIHTERAEELGHPPPEQFKSLLQGQLRALENLKE